MFKMIGILLVNVFLLLSVTSSFGISPGAGQAQIRNNQEVMQQNKQQMQQFKKNQATQEQQRLQPQQRDRDQFEE